MMWKRYMAWCNTFTGALFWAAFCFVALLIDISVGRMGMAWVMGACTLYWLWMTRKATKNKTKVKLTPEQEAKIEDATKQFYASMNEVHREMEQYKREAEHIAKVAKEKSDVQSHDREDQEAGVEGTDGRTDSEEDRTPE
jgi:hypothetical protein